MGAISSNSQTNTDTLTYDAFGAVSHVSGTTPTPFTFAGGQAYQSDADSGLKLLGNRYYDSDSGRFLSADPAQSGDNWYAYVGNNPLRHTDPTGLTSAPPSDGSSNCVEPPNPDPTPKPEPYGPPLPPKSDPPKPAKSPVTVGGSESTDGKVSGNINVSLGGGTSVSASAGSTNGGPVSGTVSGSASFGNLTANLIDSMAPGHIGSLGGGLAYAARSGLFSGNYSINFRDNTAFSLGFGAGYMHGSLSIMLGGNLQGGYLTGTATLGYRLNADASFYAQLRQNGGFTAGIRFSYSTH